uniref:Probable molybdenum cofactor guanylyltransferase n=1 Tax=Candidatus Methanogaster sp. ANME-2c ERB4 TaxID=2759911 RepID=A0A7G9YJ41_9EURY|nr:molybdenum cofactor guanylyltransferase [Methanosarcinales archaeon ANME-2c ERB4]
MRTAIILCGGRSARFGRDKTLLKINGSLMIERVIDRASRVVDEIVIAARDPEQKESLEEVLRVRNGVEVMIVCDSIVGYGPVAGILAGLLASKSKYSVCLACDLPHINSDAIDALFECATGHDAAIPQHRNGMLETLYAVYGRPMITACRDAMKNEEHTIRSAIYAMDEVLFVPTESLHRFDSDLRMFLNVNYPEDLGTVV